jgi:hypothetical protein
MVLEKTRKITFNAKCSNVIREFTQNQAYKDQKWGTINY